MALFTPVNQRRHTNVAVVRLKRAGKRFELAAYPNKVQGWRNGVEKTLDEVLQTPTIFRDVSQGILAKKEDLKAAFDTEDSETIIKMILERGDIQVSEKERGMMLDSLFKDIATVVSEKCVDPSTKRPIPVTVVERAMKEMHYSVNPHRNAKQQALDVIRQLKERIPIERAQMQLKISAPGAQGFADKLKNLISTIEKEDPKGYECVCLIDPGNFRRIEELVKAEVKSGTVEVLSLATFKETQTKDASKALPSGSGEEADDEDDQNNEVFEEAVSTKPQPQQGRRRGQKMPGEPDTESDDGSSDEKKKKGGKKKGRKKKAAVIVTTKPAAAKTKAPAKPSHPIVRSDDDDDDEKELVVEMRNMSVKAPALPKRSALTSGSEAETEEFAKPTGPIPKSGNKAKGKAKKAAAPASAFSALLEADDT